MTEFDVWDALSKVHSGLDALMAMVMDESVVNTDNTLRCTWYDEEVSSPRQVALLYQIERVKDAIPTPQPISGF